MRRLLVIGSLLLALTSAGCSEPPQKEIDQAQSAVDNARSGGAERYAPAEFVAAVSSLDKARAAVEQRDYRQALNYALDSRQRAAEAVRAAVDGKARAKHDVEALYSEAAMRANRLQAALRAAESGGATAKSLKPVQAAHTDARARLQKASAAITAGNYEDASKLLTQVRENVDAALADAQKIPLHQPRKRTR